MAAATAMTLAETLEATAVAVAATAMTLAETLEVMAVAMAAATAAWHTCKPEY
jgi:hypothetical protein